MIKFVDFLTILIVLITYRSQVFYNSSILEPYPAHCSTMVLLPSYRDSCRSCDPLDLYLRTIWNRSSYTTLWLSKIKDIMGGFQACKFFKQIFEIAVDPKGPPSGPTFWSGFEIPDLLALAWQQRQFSLQHRPKQLKSKNMIAWIS